MTPTREYDIVLYGATGFVGRLTAEFLARAGGTARIALAGRSTDRLLSIRDTLGEPAQSWQVLTADASSSKTLEAMAAQTQVVITTVGPYLRYGLPLVAACAAAGTDYADLTGEVCEFLRHLAPFLDCRTSVLVHSASAIWAFISGAVSSASSCPCFTALPRSTSTRST